MSIKVQVQNLEKKSNRFSHIKNITQDGNVQLCVQQAKEETLASTVFISTVINNLARGQEKRPLSITMERKIEKK